MKRIFLILCVAFSYYYPQQLSRVKGAVVDSADGSPLYSANVILKRLNDTLVYGVASNEKGEFILENIRRGRYELAVSFVGYHPIKMSINVFASTVDVGAIKLKKASIYLNEAQVVDRAVPATQEGDTISFNASAFKTSKDATAEELVAKMPGIEVRDGRIRAHGEEVRRVLVDGRVFFGDDPSATLRTLPAEIVERVQIFDEQSEQARFSGFDDGSSQKALNIVTRGRIQKGKFGGLLAGYGDDNRYNAKITYNDFYQQRRFAIMTNFNNVNESNFLTVGSNQPSTGFQGRGGGAFSRGIPDIMQAPSSGSGIFSTNSLGAVYSYEKEKELSLNINAVINSSSSNSSSILNRYFFGENKSGEFYNQNSLSNENNFYTRINARFEYVIDKTNEIRIYPNLFWQTSRPRMYSSAVNLNSNDTLYVSGGAQKTKSESLNGSLLAMYKINFNDKGRAIIFSYGYSPTYNLYKQDIDYAIDYYSISNVDSYVYFIDYDGKKWGHNPAIEYIEPVSSNLKFRIKSEYQYSKENVDKYSVDKLRPALFNPIGLRQTKNFSVYNNSIGFSYEDSIYRINLENRFYYSILNSKKSFPYDEKINYNSFVYLPQVRVRFDLSNEEKIRLFYSTNITEPSVEQLALIPDISNPTQAKIGNPDLKNEYRHNLNARYSLTNFREGTSFFIGASGSYAFSKISNSNYFLDKDTTISNALLRRGAKISSYENLDGFYSGRVFTVYSWPFYLIKSNVSLNLIGSYQSTPSKINFKIIRSSNLSLTAGLNSASNVGPDLDYNFGVFISYNKVIDRSTNSLRKEYYNGYGSARLAFTPGWNIYLRTESRFRYDKAFEGAKKPFSIIANANIGIKLLEKKNLEIRFSIFDIFNRNDKIDRNYYDYYYDEVYSNNLGRYFLASIIYDLRIFN